MTIIRFADVVIEIPPEELGAAMRELEPWLNLQLVGVQLDALVADARDFKMARQPGPGLDIDAIHRKLDRSPS